MKIVELSVLGDIFKINGTLTDLGVSLICTLPTVDEIWRYSNYERNSSNLDNFLQWCILTHQLSDSLLNELFPHLGANVFRLTIETTLSFYSYWSIPAMLIADIEDNMQITLSNGKRPFYEDG